MTIKLAFNNGTEVGFAHACEKIAEAYGVDAQVLYRDLSRKFAEDSSKLQDLAVGGGAALGLGGLGAGALHLGNTQAGIDAAGKAIANASALGNNTEIMKSLNNLAGGSVEDLAARKAKQYGWLMSTLNKMPAGDHANSLIDLEASMYGNKSLITDAQQYRRNLAAHLQQQGANAADDAAAASRQQIGLMNSRAGKVLNKLPDFIRRAPLKGVGAGLLGAGLTIGGKALYDSM